MPLPIPSNAALSAPVVATINHLLAQEPWAQQQLALHGGKVACIDAGALALRLRVSAGLFEVAPADAAADVTIRVKPSDLPLILQNRERAFAYVKIDGDAEFANAISQLSKTLRWEAEHDLEKLVGQVAAQRLASGARAVVAALRGGQKKLAENVAEFFLEEQPLLVRPLAVAEFSGDVTRLRDDVERMAKRLDKMEQKLARSAPSSPDLT
ncbi:ubiquinone biosynthesis accessory factor UbiJ [Janthinobacterium fluminis]|uniref:Ubiquinone biosynthesis accessory factor UbiJ n=1 Tax=Janthinobacterium fluminis TaxID=2987524 RepID=A0ABT5K6E0_9BURK|nr:SCP2 sterol-binding domain-containing protein [Janthinobacterium fluminis]MDC8760215.1 SCP2 sterol-binding domain-containing protein [Janthinobacterium fluminis]